MPFRPLQPRAYGSSIRVQGCVANSEACALQLLKELMLGVEAHHTNQSGPSFGHECCVWGGFSPTP